MILFVDGEPRLFQDPGETGTTHRLSDDDRDFIVKWMCYRLSQKAPQALESILFVADGDRIKFTFDFGFGLIAPLTAEDIKWRP